MPKRKIANTPADPTIPSTPIKIDGKTYNLVFDLGSLAEAEAMFNRQGADINLLHELPVVNLSSVRILFPCAAHKFHPELTFAQLQALITPTALYMIAIAVGASWTQSQPEPKPQGPAEGEAEPE
jgi:hypothetical protein